MPVRASALGRRRRVCLVFVQAQYWLRQPAHMVQIHLAKELGIERATGSPTDRASVGQPELAHGEVRESPEHPWPHRVPPDDSVPGSKRTLLAAGGAAWQS